MASRGAPPSLTTTHLGGGPGRPRLALPPQAGHPPPAPPAAAPLAPSVELRRALGRLVGLGVALPRPAPRAHPGARGAGAARRLGRHAAAPLHRRAMPRPAGAAEPRAPPRPPLLIWKEDSCGGGRGLQACTAACTRRLGPPALGLPGLAGHGINIYRYNCFCTFYVVSRSLKKVLVGAEPIKEVQQENKRP